MEKINEKNKNNKKEKSTKRRKDVNMNLEDKKLKINEIKEQKRGITLLALVITIIIHKQPESISGSPWGCVIGDKAVQWIGE